MEIVFTPTRYLQPKTVREAIFALAKNGDRAKIVGGGTMIHELAERGLLSHIDVLVGTESLRLSYVRKGERAVRIGASITLTELLENKALKGEKHMAGLVEALSAIRPLQVRNVATVGGAICSAVPFFDLPVALISLGCVLKIAGRNGFRSIPLEEFYKGMFETKLRMAEIVTEVVIPLGKKGYASAFSKLALTGDDWAFVNSAVSIAIGDGGVCKDVRIVVGGGGLDKCTRVGKAEAAIRGKRFDNELIKNASKKAGEIDFSGDVRASGEYRRAMSEELVARTLGSALERIGG